MQNNKLKFTNLSNHQLWYEGWIKTYSAFCVCTVNLFHGPFISVHSCSVPVTTNFPPPNPMLHPLTIKSPTRKRSLFQAQSRSSPILFVILPRVENWCQTIRLFACCTTIGYDNFIQLHNKDSVCMLHNQYNENL